MRTKYPALIATYSLPWIAISSTSADELASAMNQCHAILVPNELLSKFDQDTDKAFRDAMCGSWFSDHKETVDTTVDAKAKVLIVSAGASVNTSTLNRTVSRQEFCEDKNIRVSEHTKDMFWSRIVNDAARKEWSKCITSVVANLSGPRPVRTSLSQTGSTVRLSVKYDANYGPPQPLFTGIERANLNCVTGKIENTPIPSQGDGRSFSCSWASDDASVGDAIIHTTRGDSAASIERELKPFAMVTQYLYVPSIKLTSSALICTGFTDTVDMHEKKVQDWHDGRCTKSSDDGKWCKGQYYLGPLSVGADQKLTSPYIDCQAGSCGWNDFHVHHWFTWNAANTELSAETWAGSTPAHIRFCATKEIWETVKEPKEVANWQLAKGGGFSFRLPPGAEEEIHVKTQGGAEFSVEPGKSHAPLSLIEKAVVGGTTIWSYHINAK